MLIEIILDQLTEQGSYIDLDMVSEQLMDECPGPYRLSWARTIDWNKISIQKIIDDIKIEFDSPMDKLEWQLKWS